MAWVTVRCARCGAYVAAPARAPIAATFATCPHCGATVPVVSPRDPPPLFTWEVFPSVYPSLPLPRAPGRRLLSLVGLVLLAGAIGLAGLAGFLAWSGGEAAAPGSFTVQGVVVHSTPYSGVTLPVEGAVVNVTGESGPTISVLTNASGRFAVAGLPPGGVTVNISAPGFDPVTVQVFLSSVYTSTGGGAGLTVTLAPATGASLTTISESPFPTLETLLTSLGSGAALLGTGAVVAGLGARAARRQGPPAWAVAGGAAILLSPIALFALSDTVIFPYLDLPTAVLAAIGALAISLALVPLVWEPRSPEPTN